MAIGKTKVNGMNLARVVIEKTKDGQELAVCRFNGTQRDAYMTLMFEMRDRFEKPEDGEAPAFDPATLKSDMAKAMTGMEYRLVCLSVVDGDELDKGRVVPMFKSPEEVAELLEPTTVNEWATICNRVNGIGNAAEKEVASDFTATPSGARGSGSPACAEGPTSPG